MTDDLLSNLFKWGVDRGEGIICYYIPQSKIAGERGHMKCRGNSVEPRVWKYFLNWQRYKGTEIILHLVMELPSPTRQVVLAAIIT